jgi:hypothetical protein
MTGDGYANPFDLGSVFSSLISLPSSSRLSFLSVLFTVTIAANATSPTLAAVPVASCFVASLD